MVQTLQFAAMRQTHLIVVIVVLTLRASASAAPPSLPRSLLSRLQRRVQTMHGSVSTLPFGSTVNAITVAAIHDAHTTA